MISLRMDHGKYRLLILDSLYSIVIKPCSSQLLPAQVEPILLSLCRLRAREHRSMAVLVMEQLSRELYFQVLATDSLSMSLLGLL
jgi:hypothetical protein